MRRKFTPVAPAVAPEGATADLYLRLSTIEQLKGGSLVEQREMGLARLAERGLRLGQIWEENESGRDDERPMLAEMLARAQRGEIGAVITLYKSRLSRLAQHRQWLFYEMDRAGCEMIAIKDPRNLGKMGGILEALDGYKDEDEVKVIRDRMLSGKAQAAKQGYIPTGAGCGIYGYDHVKVPDASRRSGWRAERHVNAAQAAWVQWMYDRAEEGLSPYKISEALTDQEIPTKKGKALWDAQTVRRILTNRTYLGETSFTFDGATISLPNATPAIIAPEQHARVQEALTHVRRSARGTTHEYWLRGFVTCGRCGRHYTAHGSHHHEHAKYPRYRCGSYARKQTDCHARTFMAARLETFVWEEMTRLLRTPAVIMEYIASLRDAAADTGRVQQLTYLREQAPVLEAQKEQLAKRMADTDDDTLYAALNQRYDQLAREVADVRARQAEMETNLAPLLVTEETVDAIRAWLEAAGDDLDTWTVEERMKTLRLFRINLTVSPEGTHVRIAGRVPTQTVGLARAIGQTSAPLPDKASLFAYSVPLYPRNRH